MKAIVQSTDENYPYLPVTKPHNERYAEILGISYYHFIDPQPSDFCAAWGKVFAVHDLFKFTDVDEVLCLDGDALVLDKTRDIFDFLSYEKYPGIHIHYESGGTCDNLDHLNSGVFVMRKTEETMEFLSDVVSCEDNRLKETNRGSDWEQTHIANLFRSNPEKYKKFVKVHWPNQVFNHYSNWIFHPCNGHLENWEQKRMDSLLEAIEIHSKE